MLANRNWLHTCSGIIIQMISHCSTSFGEFTSLFRHSSMPNKYGVILICFFENFLTSEFIFTPENVNFFQSIWCLHWVSTSCACSRTLRRYYHIYYQHQIISSLTPIAHVATVLDYIVFQGGMIKHLINKESITKIWFPLEISNPGKTHQLQHNSVGFIAISGG